VFRTLKEHLLVHVMPSHAAKNQTKNQWLLEFTIQKVVLTLPIWALTALCLLEHWTLPISTKSTHLSLQESLQDTSRQLQQKVQA
jgi:hypothetical protein